MKSALLVVGGFGCGAMATRTPGQALVRVTDDAAERLAQASQRGDVETIRQLLGPEVVLGGLWFRDPDCTREFAAPGEIGGGRLDELARCLTTVKLQTATQRAVLDDVALLSYAPGIEIEARLVPTEHGRWLSWIGYADVREASDRLPTVTQQTFEQLRDGPVTLPALPGHESAWLRVRIDAAGHVTNAHVRSASSMEAARTFAAAAQSWQFHASTPAAQPLPACSLVVVKTPGTNAGNRPPSLETPNGEPMLNSGFIRTQSGGFPALSRAARRELAERNMHVLVTAVRFCVDHQGAVYGAIMVHTSGIPELDQERLRGLDASRYRPILDDGRPIAACTITVEENTFTRADDDEVSASGRGSGGVRSGPRSPGSPEARRMTSPPRSCTPRTPAIPRPFAGCSGPRWSWEDHGFQIRCAPASSSAPATSAAAASTSSRAAWPPSSSRSQRAKIRRSTPRS